MRIYCGWEQKDCLLKLVDSGGRIETRVLPRYESVCQVAREISWLGDLQEQKMAGQQQDLQSQMTSVSHSFVREKSFPCLLTNLVLNRKEGAGLCLLASRWPGKVGLEARALEGIF